MVTHVVAVALDPAHEVADPAQDPDLAPDRVLDHEEVHVTDVTADRAADHALDLDPARLLAPLAQNERVHDVTSILSPYGVIIWSITP